MGEDCGILSSNILRESKRKSVCQGCFLGSSFRKDSMRKEDVVEWATENGIIWQAFY